MAHNFSHHPSSKVKVTNQGQKSYKGFIVQVGLRSLQSTLVLALLKLAVSSTVSCNRLSLQTDAVSAVYCR